MMIYLRSNCKTQKSHHPPGVRKFTSTKQLQVPYCYIYGSTGTNNLLIIALDIEIIWMR